MRYIEDLHEGDNIIEHYLCKQKQTLKSKAGKSYYSLKLEDKTGSIDAKVWDLNNNIQSFEAGDFIKIDASVSSYQNELQLSIKKLRRSNEGEYDPANYIPTTKKSIPALFDELLKYIDTISNPYIKKLLTNIFIENKALADSFKAHSAAKSMHHNFMGGLLEHTLSVTQTCDFFAGRYKHVNRDILIACAMLHDIAKIIELSPFPTNDYTDDGELLGHIVMGSEIISKEAARIEGFPHRLESLMKHCILSHHGEYEYGSPKLPKTIEAYILHCADDIDAKAKMFEDFISADKTGGNWVGFNKVLSRNITKSEF